MTAKVEPGLLTRELWAVENILRKPVQYPECTQGSYRKTGSFLGAKSYSIQESMAPETIRNK